jgi:5S rRNA maturation endonuclease (ribonuclease M5)
MEMTTFLTSTEDQSDKIKTILTDLGYDLNDKGKYWHSRAVYRDGDNRTALQIWKNTGIWKDFVANTKYQPFKRLIELSCSDDEKVKEVSNYFDQKNDSFIESIRAPKMEVEQFFDHEEVKTLLPHYKFYNDKQISNQTLRLYNGGFSMSGKMNGRFVFPIYDENKKIIGLSGRHLLWKAESAMPKWKHLGRKANWLYPVNLPPEADQKINLFNKDIEEKKEIILIEGIGDSLALTEQGFYNHMVIFGLDISSKQISHLLSYNLNKIIISTNNDFDKSNNRGLDGAIKIYLKLIKYFDISKLEIKLPVKKDFAEMLEEKIDISEWVNKKLNKQKQVEFIIKNAHNINNTCLTILQNYLDDLKIERDTIS